MKPSVEHVLVGALLAGLMGVAQAAPVEQSSKAMARAVTGAERSVRKAPGDTAARTVLGNAYLKAGRLKSAEQAFDEALRLDPNDGSASLGLALSRIALGQNDKALDLLAGAAPRIGAADLGLALALAGAYDDAISVLELAARAPDATPRVRQNLAFAYAMGGRWRDAQAMAGRDLADSARDARILDWAKLARPRGSADQLAAMIGFRLAHDPGEPVALALREPETKLAAVAAPAAPVEGPEARPFEAVAPVKMAELPAPVPVAAPAPVPASMPVNIAAVPARLVDGRYVVQLGAYHSRPRLQQAWSGTFARMAQVVRYAPVASLSHGRGGRAYHRLSLAGFADLREATTLCRQLRVKGTDCYVRSARGDTPLGTRKG